MHGFEIGSRRVISCLISLRSFSLLFEQLLAALWSLVLVTPTYSNNLHLTVELIFDRTDSLQEETGLGLTSITFINLFYFLGYFELYDLVIATNLGNRSISHTR